MEVTLLGSGDAVGVPAPLCDCEYCEESETRRRPGLLLETDRATVVLDAGPDLPEQLRSTGTSDVDAFFVTHAHFDHVGGLHELNHAAMGFDAHVGIDGDYLDSGAFDPSEKPLDPEFSVFLSATALDHVAESSPHLVENLDVRTVERGGSVHMADLRVVPFPVEHARPTFDTLGYAVYHDGSNVVYAPDARTFGADREYADADLLFVEGAALFRAFGHGDEGDLRAAIEDADAGRTVLCNVNEHLQRMSTQELRSVVARDGYELGRDFAEYRP